MMVIGISEAKRHFSRLVRRVCAGEEVIIARGKEPVVRLVRIGPPSGRTIGTDVGSVVVPERFGEPISWDPPREVFE